MLFRKLVRQDNGDYRPEASEALYTEEMVTAAKADLEGFTPNREAWFVLANTPLAGLELISYESLRDTLEDLPLGWYPVLLKTLVLASVRKGVWAPMACAEFVNELRDELDEYEYEEEEERGTFYAEDCIPRLMLVIRDSSGVYGVAQDCDEDSYLGAMVAGTFVPSPLLQRSTPQFQAWVAEFVRAHAAEFA